MKLGHKRMCMLVSAEPTEVHHHLPASYINEPSVQQIRVRHSSCSSTRILKLQSCCIDNQGPTFIISKKHPPLQLYNLHSHRNFLILLCSQAQTASYTCRPTLTQTWSRLKWPYRPYLHTYRHVQRHKHTQLVHFLYCDALSTYNGNGKQEEQH